MIEYECCLCGKKFTGFGNNPWPLVKDTDARCCDECNYTKVLKARLEQMKKVRNNENKQG